MYLSEIARLFLMMSIGFTIASCSTTKEVPPLEPLPVVPEIAGVRHPSGYEWADLEAVFLGPDVPSPDVWKGCEKVLQTLNEKTVSRDERDRGALEWVADEPVKAHWCFYDGLRQLHTSLEKTESILEKQKQVLSAFSTLIPTARAFQKEFQDTRYLRWAIHEYRKLSEQVFYQSLTLSPDMTALLVETGPDPSSIWRRPAEQTGSVLEKYGLRVPVMAEPTPVAPARVAAPSPTSGSAMAQDPVDEFDTNWDVEAGLEIDPEFSDL